ncbi:MAG: hypothetical protein FH751_16315 [Firmicutes bacterium]|nr:hypothetical protein [Bacillota bacterium]
MRRMKIMIGSNDKITRAQNSGMIITQTIGVGILSLPRLLAEDFASDGFLLILIGGLVAALFLTILTKLLEKYKGEAVDEISERLLGKFFKEIILIIFVIYYVVVISYIVRIFAEVVKMFLLLNTPTEVIIMTMLLSLTYLVRKGIECIARIVQIVIPLVTIPVALLMLTILKDAELDNLLPFFQIGIGEIVKGIPLVLFSFLGYELIFFTTAFVDNNKKMLRYNLSAISFITTSYILVYFTTYVQFGKEEVKHLLWPTLSLMKTVDIPGAFLENIEGVVMGLWVLVVFANISPALFNGSLALSKIARNKEYKQFVLPLIPIIYILSLMPDNLAEVYEYIDIFTKYFGPSVAIFLPVFLFIVSLFKGKKGESRNA